MINIARLSGSFDQLAGQCSAGDNYEGVGTDEVLLTEFSCSPDSILDLATGSCLPLTCDTDCTAGGEV